MVSLLVVPTKRTCDSADTRTVTVLFTALIRPVDDQVLKMLSPLTTSAPKLQLANEVPLLCMTAKSITSLPSPNTVTVLPLTAM